MRTTLTIDDDIAVQLERLRRRGRGSLRQIVNDLLRKGLSQQDARPPAGTAQRTRPANLGRCLIGSLDDVTEALSVAEGEDFR